MSKILEMRQKRAEVWDKARAFLDERTNESGVMTAEDSQQYERMEQEVVDLGHTIDRMERAEQMDREMNERVSPNLASRPMRTQETLRGIASAEYRNAFWKHMRDIDRRSPEVRNALQVGTLSEGGYQSIRTVRSRAEQRRFPAFGNDSAPARAAPSLRHPSD